MSDLLKEELDEFWLDFESGYETYKAGNDSRDCDVEFIQTYCQTLQVGYCEKFCEDSSCWSWTDQAMICCSNCEKVCLYHDYESFLVSCAMKKPVDKTLLIASTVTLFSLPLVALVIYFCCHIIKKSGLTRDCPRNSTRDSPRDSLRDYPCYKYKSCRKPSFKCCDKISKICLYLNQLRESKKQNTSPPNCDNIYDKPYAFDDYEIP